MKYSEKTMNHTSDDPTGGDKRFDRLVDDHLSDQQYKTLLASLDTEPDGWRRCALAFLEAQAWGQEFRAVVRPAESRGTVSTAVRVSAAGTLRPASLLAMAAGLLVAFTLGSVLSGLWTTSDIDRFEETANVQLELEPNTGLAADVQVANEANEPVPMGNVTFFVSGPDGYQSEQIQVPIFDSEQWDSAWLTDRQSTVPDDLVEEWRRLGHQVRRHRQWVSLQSEDGRRFVMPVEEVEIVPVSGRTYQ